VVLAHHLRESRIVEYRHHLRPDQRVRLDDVVLGVGQCAGLVDDVFGDPELAHVVHDRREPDPLALGARELHGFGDHVGVASDALAVTVGVGVTGFQRDGELLEEARLLVDAQRAPFQLPGTDPEPFDLLGQSLTAADAPEVAPQHEVVEDDVLGPRVTLPQGVAELGQTDRDGHRDDGREGSEMRAEAEYEDQRQSRDHAGRQDRVTQVPPELGR
jgi:hypothetical protein